MTRESLAFALSGTFFGLLVGWIIGSQQGGGAAVAPAGPAPTAASAAAAPAFDAALATRLEQQAASEPANAAVRVSLGNVYFDAERFDQAIRWYGEALEIDPANVNASTDLAVALWEQNQPDQALAQIDRSLAIDPTHVKTLFNQGVIRAFGKQDLEGARESWERVVELAPTTPEGQRAQQGLDGLAAAHASEVGAGE